MSLSLVISACTAILAILELQVALEREFTKISNWYTDNRLTINVKKTKLMLAGSKRMLSLFEDFELQSNGTQIDRVQSFKYLGVTMDSKWSWKPHISNLLKKLGHCLSLFNRIFHMLDNRTRIAFYNGLVLPHLDYANTVWGDQPGLKSEMEKLQSFQNKFAKKIKLGKMSSSEAPEVSELAPSGWKTSFSPMYRRRKCNQRRHSATS